MKAFLTAKQAGLLLGCAPKKVTERMRRGIWDIGTVVPSKKKSGNCTYEIIPKKLAELAVSSTEEVLEALKENRPIRV